MKTSKCIYYLLFCTALIFSACGAEKTPEEKAADKINEGVEKLTEGLGEARKELGGGMEGALGQLENVMEGLKEDGVVNKVQPLNFRKLKELYPESAGGMKRISSSGESNGVAGIKVSTAKASFEGDNKRIDVDITDTGGVGMAMMGLAAWSMVEIDKESDDGFERTTTYKGNKAFEKCSNKGRCEFSVFVGKRFIVTAKGRGNDLEIDDLHDVIDDIGLDKLEDMKDEEG